MQISEAGQSVTFASRAVTGRVWLVWGLLFLPGLVLLVLLPESARLVGLLIWMALWLASILLLPRFAGELVQVTVDKKSRKVVFLRGGKVTRELAFGEVKTYEVRQISTAARPYRAFQLVAVLRNASRITLAVDPKEAVIQRCLTLTRQYSR